MAKIKSKSSIGPVAWVLGIAFGILAIALTVAALSGTTELRSKAAPQEEVIVKNWEFNKGAEGWVADNALEVKVQDGYFQAVTDSKGRLLVVRNPQVNVTLPAGAKKLKFALAVGSFGRPEFIGIPEITGRPKPTVTPYPVSPTFDLRVRVKSNGVFSADSTVKVPADGQFHEYEVGLPWVVGRRIEAIRFEFTGLQAKPSVKVSFDWIKLVYWRYVRPTPSPWVTVTPMPTSTQEVTKQGVVRRDNLEGTVSPYVLVTDNKETYRLVVDKSFYERDPRGMRPLLELNLDAYVGHRVEVTGRLGERGEVIKPRPWYLSGIPTKEFYTVLYIRSIKYLDALPTTPSPRGKIFIEPPVRDYNVPGAVEGRPPATAR
ncbi:MAG: hypothetical protein ACOY0S_02715 [Patescibacteria group bacterium]